jgi:hypothetical protein
MKGGPVARPTGGTPAPAPTPSWRPGEIPSAKPVNVGAILGALQSGQSGGGGGYGGAIVPVHNPQPNYWPSQNAMGGGNGFAGGTGWAGTNVGASSTNGISQWGGDSAQNAPNPFQQPTSGGSTMTPLGTLAGAYQSAQDEARAANEERYKNILAGYDDRWNRAMGQLEGVGNQQREDMNRRYDNNKGEIAQSLVARGMSNSTVKDNIEAGNERERNQASNRLEEALTRERLGYDTGLQGDLLQFMERRNDTYPDLNQLLQLAQMMGVATPQGGGGMMGGVSPANGFVAPGGFGMGGGGFVGGGGANNPQALNAAQQMMLQQNMQGFQFNPNSSLSAYQQKLLQQNMQKAQGTSPQPSYIGDVSAYPGYSYA